jgi:hypothetical protein
MVFLKNNAMRTEQKIRTELVRLSTGGRLLRLTEPGSGLTLERALDAKQPVLRQMKQLLDMLNGALESASQSQFYKGIFGKIGAKSPTGEIPVVHGASPKHFAARKLAKSKAGLVLSKS